MAIGHIVFAIGSAFAWLLVARVAVGVGCAVALIAGPVMARELGDMRLLGLFDRPAMADCLNALWTGDEIGGLTGSLLGISDAQRNITLKRLEDANLITVNRDRGSEALVSLDAHPLLREYFATRLRKELPGAWRAAHRRLYEHLRDTTHEGGSRRRGCSS